jgi:hypothetical protein
MTTSDRGLVALHAMDSQLHFGMVSSDKERLNKHLPFELSGIFAPRSKGGGKKRRGGGCLALFRDFFAFPGG